MIENLANFVTLAEAAAYLRVSERTVRRRIETGELQSRKDGAKLLVYLPEAAKVDRNDDMIKIEVDGLKQKIKVLENKVQKTEDSLQELEKRTDWLRGALESLVYQHRPIWDRLFRRKQLPPPDGDVIDMEGKE